ncbi:MAG: PBP1A family penicillin-binding protein [Alphaproteobacteria bacterium]
MTATSRKKGRVPHAETNRPPRKARARPRRGFLPRLLKWTLTLMVWAVVAGAGVIAYYARDLPDIGVLSTPARQPSITVLAADGTTIATLGNQYGEQVRLSDLPRYLPQAVLAIEDRRFYSHFGVDPVGLARAMIVNLREMAIVQGGSTITQQLAKNLFLSPERTLKRKIQESLLALWLEHRFTKDQILTIYLNRVYLGAGAYGVDAAARRYFAKPARSVTLYEAAMIAGLLKAPSRYAPTRAFDLTQSRANQVLAAMVEAGYVTAAEAKAARESPAMFVPPPAAGSGVRYFTDWVVDQLDDFLGGVDRDLVVRTTLDPRLQRLAEEKVAASLAASGKESNASQAAMVVLSPEGAVRALVGGRDYVESQFDRATQGLRQPGSAFKIFVYLAALEAGLHPTDLVLDAPINIQGWRPENYDGSYKGEITLTDALAESRNTAAVRVAQRVGIWKVIDMAERLGITSPLKPDLSLALGTNEVTLVELTSAMATLADDGIGVWPHAITEIRDWRGRELYVRSGSGPGRVIAESVVGPMAGMLTRVVTDGTGKAARLDRPAAGKTGTSQDFRDAWFVGYTADLVAGVWAGNDDGTPMKRVTGGRLPAKLWHDFMTAALEGVPPRPLPGNEQPPAMAEMPAGEPAFGQPGGAAGPAQASSAEPANRQRTQRRSDYGAGFWDQVLQNIGIGR